ncbi:MAG: hypothetical protein WA700_13570 [Acidobacteriaceae bacterium]
MNLFDASKVAEINKTAAQSFFNPDALKMSGLDDLDVPTHLWLLCEEHSFLLGETIDECVTEALTDWLESRTGLTVSELLGTEGWNYVPPGMTVVARTI